MPARSRAWIIKVLEADGWQFKRPGANHDIYDRVAIASLALLPLVAPGTDRAQTSTLVQPIAMNAFVVGLPLLFLAFVGGLVWVIGLWRARFVGLWALVLYVVWFLVESPLGRPLTSIHLGLLISEVPFAVVIGWIGINLIRRRGGTETAGPT